MNNQKPQFYLHEHYRENFYKNRDDGLSYLRDKKIIFAGLCRSAESYIETNLNELKNLVDNKCLDYKILIFENDSLDNTKKIIENLQNTNEHIILYSQDFIDRPHYGHTKEFNRIKYLAEYRNLLQTKIRDNFSDYDYIIIVDFDFISLSIDGFFHSFGNFSHNAEIGAVCGNSFTISEHPSGDILFWNHDCWAFRGSWWEDWETMPPTTNKSPMFWFGLWVPPIGSPLIKINSGFGGMCIYKTNFYLSGKYGAQDCEHVVFHKSIYDSNKDFALYLNPAQTVLLHP